MCSDIRDGLLLEAGKTLKRIKLLATFRRGRAGLSYINSYEIIEYLVGIDCEWYIDLLTRWISEANEWASEAEYKFSQDLTKGLG